MMSAGSCVEWLRDDLKIVSSVAESDGLAASCSDSGGVWFVPALLGLGTPLWDYGARGTLLGLTRGSGRAEIARAVLEGIAHRAPTFSKRQRRTQASRSARFGLTAA